MEHPFQIVVFGATSFVGQILTRYLRDHQQDNEFRWAIAGRSSGKLEELKESLGAEDLPIIVADANDAGSLVAMCEKTALVISTVGPYALYGEPLVQACAQTGTDYCDLTGEVQWMWRMIDRYQESARQSGARIVHTCGFDSIPSDLGVWFCQQKAREIFGSYCTEVKMRVRKMRGGMSGGTIASMINGAKEALRDPGLRKVLQNPYALCPPDAGYTARQHSPRTEYDEDLISWVAPFVMSSINTRVVFRSNALAGTPYGKDFRYNEATLTGDGGKGRRRAKALAWGLGVFGLGIALPPSRWILEKFVLPKPGEGPSPKAQEEGFYILDFIGRTGDGRTIHCTVSGDRDPGYGSTAKMLAQAALCLSSEVDRDKVPGGFWTPATALDGKLLARLERHAGLRFELISSDSP
ncbi:saccharopine dehydrogenase family protein [Gilvimarinus sp. F26214L]|uniref:saccharopine dehydrogenase family protein n=1 Tax=Gilvimarinus sp. DZF01 TaxID=3461371 RepID=UPI004045801E